MKVLAIRTDFEHHGDHSGYKQILKYTNPFKVLGIVEKDIHLTPRVKQKYQWLHEFEIRRYKKEIDLIHIMYGEDYFRFSTSLFKDIPVVATFHQPPESLEKEITTGSLRGTIGKITHRLSKKRFEKLAAAIVTNQNQKLVLKRVMPESKIHVIPLGIQLLEINKFLLDKKPNLDSQNVITVGNWLRDWDFYFEVVRKLPECSFQLINRVLPLEYVNLAKTLPNLTYFSNISDTEMYNLMLKASVQFHPVTGIAGSNAILQGMALGCPIVLTNFEGESNVSDEAIFPYQRGYLEDAIRQIKGLLEMSKLEKLTLRNKAKAYASKFSWEEIAQRTKEVYKQVVK